MPGSIPRPSHQEDPQSTLCEDIAIGNPPTERRILPDEFYSPFFSDFAIRRPNDPIRQFGALDQSPGILSFLAGKPNPATFPITSLQFMARDPTNADSPIKIELTPLELQTALQYNLTAGIYGLRDWLTGLQEEVHGRKPDDTWTLCVGAGSQDLIYKAITATLNPGDPVLIEAPVYAGILPAFQTLGCDIYEVETDDEGIRSDSLRSIYENWPVGKPKPKVLYTVPVGCNPTGMTASLERRLEVLALARQHNFLIFEDDPYYYLYYGKKPQPPSYFSLERDQPEIGRVLRFDSLSKVLSSGLRLGFVSGPKPLIAAMIKHTDTSNLQPSTFSQVIALSILSRWGYTGFLTHTEQVAEFYHKKRDVFQAAMQRHLGGLAEWTPPEAGMFFWFKLLLSPSTVGDEESSQLEESCSRSLIEDKAIKRGVLALPGTVFFPKGRTSGFVRASFSVLEEDDVNKGLERLKDVILEARRGFV